MVGSFKLRFMATCDRRRSEDLRSSRGEFAVVLDLLSVALMVAAAAREWVDGRGEELLLSQSA